MPLTEAMVEGSNSGRVVGPGPLGMLALEQPLQLLELLHCLVLHVGVGDLQADAVRGPVEFSGEHLSQHPGHHRHHLGTPSQHCSLTHSTQWRGQMAELLGNRASNQKVTGSIPGRAKLMLCPWARHFTLLASGECPCTYCKSLWIRVSAK